MLPLETEEEVGACVGGRTEGKVMRASAPGISILILFDDE